MSRVELKLKLSQILSSALKNESLELEEDLKITDLEGWSSLTHMLIISEVEEGFKIIFELEDYNQMITIGSLLDLIELRA